MPPPTTGSAADFMSASWRAQQQIRAQLAQMVQQSSSSAMNNGLPPDSAAATDAAQQRGAMLPALFNNMSRVERGSYSSALCTQHELASGMLTPISDTSDDPEKEQQGEPPSLPPEPFKTLLSAGVRMQGRSREELLLKAKHIRQRRRESAARCRARRAQHFVELEHENKTLRAENLRLKSLLNSLERKDL